jgi:predicted ATP-grasp superfamily ATP-dependent carboligase
VYLFAKNKQRLSKHGILSAVPEPDVIRGPMDKALTIQAAQRVGFPCPKTYFPASDRDVERILADSRPPWIVKPRFTAHGARMVYVEEPAALWQAYEQVRAFQDDPIVQEYLGGGQRRSYYVIVDRDSNIVSLLCPDMVRLSRIGYKVHPRAAISTSMGPLLPEMRMLIRELRLWGAYSIQTQIDPRDGLPKLLEINARFGHYLWWRTGLGVNEPSIFLQLAQGKTPTGNREFPEGVALLDPIADFFYLCSRAVEDVLALARTLRRQPARTRDSSDVDPRNIFDTLRAYRRDYVHRRPKIFCPEFRNLLHDPAPCLQFFWFKFKGMVRGYMSYLRPRRVRA